MRVMIFGATGLLGKALVREWTEDQVVGFGSKDVDIRDGAQVRSAVEKRRPDWIVNAAAYTDVDGCESNRELAFTVNHRGAVNVADAARSFDARLLFLSTDYVFDGRSNTPYETDHARAPRTVYGKSKARAEEEIGNIFPDACIVRTSWLFGIGGKCFPDTILRLAASRPEIDVVNDQRGCPTYAPDLARVIVSLCRAGVEKVIHATNSGDCTWFDFAREIVKCAGLSTVIRPTTSEQFVRLAERPKYSVLSRRSLNQYGITMPNWKDALRDYLSARNAFGQAEYAANKPSS